MQKVSSILCTFIAGFLLFFAWSGYIREEFNSNEFQGYVIKKERSEKVISMGSSLISQTQYTLFFEDGKRLQVPHAIYLKIREGSHIQLIKNKDNMTLTE
ncbi:hypothetical protein [Fictibacillus phosphorivorans]|uniref:hypothetical protein n=1 Tax=Fictibacillus phosphorivorans TaxID=1221500 RepID=UPI001293980A|nr:hypothetical protein [Fictibacillus phosphorivorans]MQR96286.1 hypothetical protein [Fictibacillus phosphorivorans]